jgi:hypothetical protein
MASDEGARLDEVELACSRVIDRICMHSNAEDLAGAIDVILEERARGRIVDPVCASPRTRLLISKSLWSGAGVRQRDASIASAVSCMICTLRDMDPAIRTEGLAELFGYGPVWREPDWRQWEAWCRKVIKDAYAFLGPIDLAEKTDVKWNGRLKWPAAVCRWDVATKRGTIELAKRIWPLLIEEEQEEIVVHGCCIVATSAASDLGPEYELLQHCGYRTPVGGYAFFPGNRYQGGLQIGAPHRIHLHEERERWRRAGWGGRFIVCAKAASGPAAWRVQAKL